MRGQEGCLRHADILLNFRTTFVSKGGHVIYDGRQIALNYLRGWFTLDLIAALPLEILSFVRNGLVVRYSYCTLPVLCCSPLSASRDVIACSRARGSVPVRSQLPAAPPLMSPPLPSCSVPFRSVPFRPVLSARRNARGTRLASAQHLQIDRPSA